MIQSIVDYMQKPIERNIPSQEVVTLILYLLNFDESITKTTVKEYLQKRNRRVSDSSFNEAKEFLEQEGMITIKLEKPAKGPGRPGKHIYSNKNQSNAQQYNSLVQLWIGRYGIKR